MWRIAVLLSLALVVCGLAVWVSRGDPPQVRGDTDRFAQNDVPESTPAVPRPGTLSTLSLPGGREERAKGVQLDSVVLSSCSLVAAKEQDVSSQVDGVFREVLVGLGDPVEVGQVLGRLDDRQLSLQVELLSIRASSRSAELIAKAQHDEAEKRVAYALKANQSGVQSVSDLEYQGYLAQHKRYAQEMAKAREEQQVAQKELARARHLLGLHEIRSEISGEIVKEYKRKGESVKQMESLFRIADTRRLRVEGFCKVHQANLLRVGMRAQVEPEVTQEQLTELRGHTGTVTAFAVSPDGHWLASASEDRTVILWSWPGGDRQAVLSHPVEVHTVAFVKSPDDNNYRLLTGSADGQVRCWRVTSQRTPVTGESWPGAHEGPIRALAISPDGRRCATAGEDRRIAIWDTATGQRLYWLHADEEDHGTAHQGAVTSVQFATDGRVISAGRDNVIRTWQLNDNTAHLLNTFSGRTGEVPQLGVSSDGTRLLFDHGEELRILDGEDGACIGTLTCRRQGRFQGMALFSASGRLVLAGGSNGRLQLLKAPASPETIAFFRNSQAQGFRRDSLIELNVLGGGNALTAAAAIAPWSVDSGLPCLWGLHAFEVRQFLVPGTATITCGAFAPDESVVFTGGTDRAVRVWAVPSAREWAQPREATITFVGSQVERGTDRVRIRAELENPDGALPRLRPGTYVDLRLDPGGSRQQSIVGNQPVDRRTISD